MNRSFHQERYRSDLESLVDSSREIMAAADADGRDLTDDELQTIRDNTARFKAVQKKAETLAEAAELGDSLSRPQGRVTQPDPLPGSGTRPVAPGVNRLYRGRDHDEDGDVLYGLRPDQRVYDWARKNGESTYSGVTLGSYLKALLFGPRDSNHIMALSEGTAADGGFTVPTILSSRLIDLLRAQSVVFRAGALTWISHEGHGVSHRRRKGDPADDARRLRRRATRPPFLAGL